MPLSEALSYGFSGVMIRSCGIPWDLRCYAPYSVYKSLDFYIPTGYSADCYDRYLLRIWEMRESVRLIKQCLAYLGDSDIKHSAIKVDDMKIVPPPRALMKVSMDPLYTILSYIQPLLRFAWRNLFCHWSS